MRTFGAAIVGITVATWLASASAVAAIEAFTIGIKDHRFLPAELSIPADKKFKLIVQNHDATPEEFESYELNREKIIGGAAAGTIFLGPLSRGSYPFFGDFHPDTAQGVLTVE